MGETAISGHRLRCAARALRAGGIIAHATEGVWGLTADALDADAVLRVIALKARDPGKGLIVIAAAPDALAPLVAPGADAGWQRALDSWPGPNTWLLPAAPDAPWWLTGGQPTIALRVPAHGLTRSVCRQFGGPLVSTSANRAACRPVDQPWQARARFGAGLDMVLGGRCDTPGRPSTIRDARTGAIRRG